MQALVFGLGLVLSDLKTWLNGPHFSVAVDKRGSFYKRCVCVGAVLRGRKSVGISNECIVTFYLLY